MSDIQHVFAPAMALLRIGASRIALEQRDVAGAESLDRVFWAASTFCVGSIRAQGEDRLVYAMDEQLRPRQSRSPEHRICAVLAYPAGCFGLLCDELIVLSPREIEIIHLPRAIQRPGTPVHSLMRLGDDVAVRTSAQALGRWLGANDAAVEHCRARSGSEDFFATTRAGDFA